MEIWKSVPSHEGLYEVSNLGRVKSLARIVYVSPSAQSPDGNFRAIRERILKGICRASDGRLTVTLWACHRARVVPIHVMVLEAFKGPRPNGFYGCHDDGNPINNRMNNLYWGTPKQNSDDKLRHGTHLDGTRIPFSKLSQDDVIEIRRLKGQVAQSVLAERFGVRQNTISRVQTGARWKDRSGNLALRIAA